MRPTWQNYCLALDEFIYELCEAFVDKYYWDDADMYLIWEEVEWMILWPLFVNDDYFDLDEVYTAMWYNIPRKCLIKFLDYRDDCLYDNSKPIYNLKSFYFLKYKDGNKSSSKKEDDSWTTTITKGIDRTPRTDWGTVIWKDYDWGYYWPFWQITLCATKSMKCWSVKCSHADDTDDVTDKWDVEDDGWENEEARAGESCEARFNCRGWSCERARGSKCNKWRQHSKL